MGDLIGQAFTGVQEVIVNSASAIKDGFMNLVYVDPAADVLVVSDFMQFIFLMMGFTIGFGILYKLFSLVRLGRH